jgi:DNA sulfur modification protein DndE
MLPNRVRISKTATDSLKVLKSRTAVTPNILCRIALVLSLREGYEVKQSAKALEGTEFNLSTLLGDQTVVYECLLRQIHGEMNEREASLFLSAHIDDGLEKLKRIRSVADLLSYA